MEEVAIRSGSDADEDSSLQTGATHSINNSSRIGISREGKGSIVGTRRESIEYSEEGNRESSEHDSLLGTSERREGRGVRKGALFYCCCLCYCIGSGFRAMGQVLCSSKQLKARTVNASKPSLKDKYPSNVIRNQKYNVITFLPVVLFNQFKFFLNLYFLLMAMSQFVPNYKLVKSTPIGLPLDSFLA